MGTAAFATHSSYQIDAARIIMGHNVIETAAGYRHPVVEAAINRWMTS
jgi:hypothetical protein